MHLATRENNSSKCDINLDLNRKCINLIVIINALNFCLLHYMFIIALYYVVNCSFSARTYSINENRGPLKVRLNLDKPAPQDFNVTIFDFRGNTS